MYEQHGEEDEDRVQTWEGRIPLPEDCFEKNRFSHKLFTFFFLFFSRLMTFRERNLYCTKRSRRS